MLIARTNSTHFDGVIFTSTLGRLASGRRWALRRAVVARLRRFGRLRRVDGDRVARGERLAERFVESLFQ